MRSTACAVDFSQEYYKWLYYWLLKIFHSFLKKSQIITHNLEQSSNSIPGNNILKYYSFLQQQFWLLCASLKQELTTFRSLPFWSYELPTRQHESPKNNNHWKQTAWDWCLEGSTFLLRPSITISCCGSLFGQIWLTFGLRYYCCGQLSN